MLSKLRPAAALSLVLACGEAGPKITPASAGSGGALGASGGGGAGVAGAAAGGTLGGGGAGASAGGAAGAGGSVAGAGAGAGAGVAGADNGGSGGVAGSGGAPVELADLHYYGRWNLAQAGKAITVNSGSHITAKFTGSAVSARFDTSGNASTPTVTIEIDDEAPVEKEIAATLELATGLGGGEHTVTLFARGMNEFESRWSQPLVSATTFLGFMVTGGALVPSARPERLKMEILGDSITEGVALHSAGPAGQTTPNWKTDGPRGYAALTARALDAEWRQVGFGRQGLTIGGNGGVPKAADAFNWFYAGVARDDWQPDLVVINQGTNDCFGNVDGSAFASAYRSFLELVREAYPEARIAAMRPLAGCLGAEISAQVSALANAGDAKIHYIDTMGWTGQGDFTDGVHPNEAGSVKIAGKLVTALQSLLD